LRVLSFGINNIFLFYRAIFIFVAKKGEIMAKQQSFADKAKGKKKVEGINVKLIKTIKTSKGSYKFNERFVRLDDISKVTTIK
jgi:hypothetical protein